MNLSICQICFNGADKISLCDVVLQDVNIAIHKKNRFLSIQQEGKILHYDSLKSYKFKYFTAFLFI